MTVFMKTNRLVRKATKTERQIGFKMAVSSLDKKGNKAIKKNFVFLANRSVFPNTVTSAQ